MFKRLGSKKVAPEAAQPPKSILKKEEQAQGDFVSAIVQLELLDKQSIDRAAKPTSFETLQKIYCPKSESPARERKKTAKVVRASAPVIPYTHKRVLQVRAEQLADSLEAQPPWARPQIKPATSYIAGAYEALNDLEQELALALSLEEPKSDSKSL